MADSFGSEVFDHTSPLAVKSRNDIIAEIMGEVKSLLETQQFSIAAECRPPLSHRLNPSEQEAFSKKAESAATGVLHHSYRDAKIKGLRQTTQGLKNTLYDLFTNAKQSDFLTDDTTKRIPKEVLDNFMKIKNAQLRKAADASRGLVPTSNWFKEVNHKTMSKEDIKKIFVEFQKKELLRLINELILARIETVRMEDMKRRIITPGLSLSFDEIFWLIHKYIEYKYSIDAPHITSGDALLEFIRDELQDLSAIMSPYYGASKDFIDFRIYLPLLRKYIEFILIESGISFDGDSATVANSIVRIIRRKLCYFVKIAGDPDVVIKTSTRGDVIILITRGVQNFLNVAVPYTVAQGGGAADQGGNRRRIKKYKNRSSRRSSRRTTRITKYRTNRYKIKNKKTRKIR